VGHRRQHNLVWGSRQGGTREGGHSLAALWLEEAVEKGRVSAHHRHLWHGATGEELDGDGSGQRSRTAGTT
jgi:hypothetical protein